jgi:putative pyruvate formate lyase activating enzyme
MKDYFLILQNKKKARFLQAKKSGLLDEKVIQAKKIMESCELCERRCRVNRMKNEKGFCGVGKMPKIFSIFPHYGEEEELVPSGTFFFSGCTLRCAYCQNAPQSISSGSGEFYSPKSIAGFIEDMDCRNVNFVGGDPVPDILFILETLKHVNRNIPVVFNSNAYYSEKTAELLKDIIDVYLLDFRYFNGICAEKLSAAPGYPEAAKRNFLSADADLMIRLLVIPGHIECDAKPILKWIKENLKNYRLNILQQYWPAWQAEKFPEISRRLKPEEYREVTEYAKSLGLSFIKQSHY